LLADLLHFIFPKSLCFFFLFTVVCVDAIHVKVYRKRSVETEAFYVVKGVKEDNSRDVKPGRRFAANG